MKQIIYLSATVIAVIIIIFINKENNQQDSLVNIQGTGFYAEYDKVTLKYYDHNTLDYKQIESKKLNKQKGFEFQFPFTTSNLYELNFDEKEMIPISVENPGVISINRTDGSTEIEGSESTRSMISFTQKNDELQDKYFGQLKIKFDKAMAENNQEEIQELTRQSELFIQEYLKEFRQLIVELGTTPAGYYALQFSDFNKEIEFIENRLAAFQKDAPGSLVTKALETQVAQVKITSIGNTPPPFEAKNKQGNLIALSDFKGKVVLIDFWASWCRACRVENPKFVALYKKYKTQDFEIISISQDDSEGHWLKAIKQDGIEAWTQIHDADKSITKLYSVSSLPQNVLLDKSGKIIAKNISAEDLAQLLVAL